ncbi:hypothetical protein [uncultured Paraglaciecola sp.]|uniref:hypothetical protein n=1 Tax=uncultured Paraglaciecola sp. TaxID=1765024 RepID=UPI0030DAEEA0|tara:strand:+ start:92677 stop:93402 length:726 start_codon:yes stop_codon:yes gene_type:complete
MTSKKIVLFAFLILAFTWGAYWYNFGYLQSQGISKTANEWALLGDFLGGVLNPILTFLTILILIKSLTLQKNENNKTKKFEKIRSFELHFFNMIDSQKVLFNNLKLKFDAGDVAVIKTAGAAVISIEDIVIHLKDNGKKNEDIKVALESLDNDDSIYSATRTFAIIAKLVQKKLSDQNGFTNEDRKEYYEVLLNFTDYSLIRLILITMKYFDNAQVTALRENIEFLETLKSAGIEEYAREI